MEKGTGVSSIAERTIKSLPSMFKTPPILIRYVSLL